MRYAIATLCLVATALPAAEVSDLDAYSQTRELADGGRIIISRIRVRTPGVYYVAGGYVIDYDARLQFFRGDKSAVNYYDVKELRAEAPGIVEVVFKLKALPPLAETKEGALLYLPRVAVYPTMKDIPVYTPPVILEK